MVYVKMVNFVFKSHLVPSHGILENIDSSGVKTAFRKLVMKFFF